MKKTLRFSRFDASLNTDLCNSRTNAVLTLTLRLGFRQINPASGAANGTYHDYGDPSQPTRKIIKWTPVQWKAWKADFCRSAELFWDRKFWLVNRRGVYPFKDKGQVFLPNFACRFDLIGQDGATGAHHVIDVVRLDPTETWFGSHSTLYDSADTVAVEKDTDSKGKPIMQRAHVHEVGHLLGLGHVDIGKPHCPPSGNTNALACYGVTDVSMNSVMGAGMRLDVRHAAPWLNAFGHFVKTAPASALYKPAAKFVKPVVASKQRQLPRTVAEFEGGELVTTVLPGR